MGSKQKPTKTQDAEWVVVSSYTNSGVTTKIQVATKRSEGAARRYADKWNERASRNNGGFAYVEKGVR